MTQCAKIIVGFTANVGNVFIKRLQTFFLIYIFHVLTFLMFFAYFYLNVHYIYDY